MVGITVREIRGGLCHWFLLPVCWISQVGLNLDWIILFLRNVVTTEAIPFLFSDTIYRGSTAIICLYVRLFYDLYFFWFYFYPPELLLKTCVDNIQCDFWGPYPWPLDPHEYSFPISSKNCRNTPGHCVCHRPIRGLRPSFHHLQIRNKHFHQKKMSLQSVVSGHQFITESYLILRNKILYEKDVTLNAAPS